MEEIINKIKGINVLLYGNVYTFKSIKKKNKEDRKIYIPNNRLKNIQKQIKKQLEKDFAKDIQCMKYQNAYIRGKSIITNASPHTKKSYVIKLDVEEYFDSITFPRIYGKLKKRYKDDIALKIAQLSCYRINKKHIALAQGAPVSPILSNLIGKSIDIYFIKYLKKFSNNVSYTRYSDDITISTNEENIFNIISEENFEDFNEKTGFKLNFDKSRYLNYRKRKVVTGIVVNEKLNISKKYRNDLKNYLRNSKWNLDKTIIHYEQKNPKILKKINDKNLKRLKFEKILQGKIQYIAQVKGKNDSTYLKYGKLFNKIEEFTYKFDERDKFQKNIISILSGEDSNLNHGTGFFLEIGGKEGLITNYHVLEELIENLKSNDEYLYKIQFYSKSKTLYDSYLFEIDIDEEKLLEPIIFHKEFYNEIKYSKDLDYCFIPIKVLEKSLDKKINKKNFLKINKEIKLEESLKIIGYPQGHEKYQTLNGEIKEEKSNGNYVLNFKVGEGASGSPVIQKGKVIGIYYGEEKISEKVENYETGALFIDINLIYKDMLKND